MCGSGTLLIEAALIFGDSAPGLSRKYFGFAGWKGHDEELWAGLVDEAVAREEAGMERNGRLFSAMMPIPLSLPPPEKISSRAGLGGEDPGHSGRTCCPAEAGKKRHCCLQPSLWREACGYGRGDAAVSSPGTHSSGAFPGWQAGIFIANTDLADRLGIAWESSHKLYNGPLACRLFVGPVSPPARMPRPFNGR